MKRWLGIGALLLIVASSAWLFVEWRAAHNTIADSSYEPAIRTPLFANPRPALLFDEAHRNRHTLNGTYKPFLKLAMATGMAVQPLREPPTTRNLHGAAVLMVVLAQGPVAPGDQPAFSTVDVSAIRDFVADGGGLIFVVDHYPFADAAQKLASAFGVELSRGMTVDEEHADKTANDESQLVFSRANGLLAVHPTTEGLKAVILFTGVSMSIPPGASPLLLTGAIARDLILKVQVRENGGDEQTLVDYSESRPAGGRAMAIALAHGRGRVVIVGDAGMLTAQYDRRKSRRYGLTTPGFDNERFAVNLLRWVVRRP